MCEVGEQWAGGGGFLSRWRRTMVGRDVAARCGVRDARLVPFEASLNGCFEFTRKLKFTPPTSPNFTILTASSFSDECIALCPHQEIIKHSDSRVVRGRKYASCTRPVRHFAHAEPQLLVVKQAFSLQRIQMHSGVMKGKGRSSRSSCWSTPYIASETVGLKLRRTRDVASRRSPSSPVTSATRRAGTRH